jgi:thiol:disulfide interchange protein DsbA
MSLTATLSDLRTLRSRSSAVFAAFTAAVLLALLAGSASAQLVEGKNYYRMKSPQPTETGKKIEVIEFFSYGCPHCAELEPYLDGWLAKLPPDVQFRRIPVMFQERWIPLAKIYYTLEALGEEEKLSPDLFKALHGSGLPLWNDKVFFDWAAQKGLDRKKVEDVWGSFTIAGKMNRARQLAQAYDIQAVPTIIVDGKFVTSSDRAGNHASLPAAIDALIAKARTERPKS